MKKHKIVPPVERTKDGKLILNLDATEASIDWFKYARLKKLADAGDEEARKECERMDNS
jgi:hypothetical protein